MFATPFVALFQVKQLLIMSSKSTSTSANAILLSKYQKLQHDKILVTYVWTDGRVEYPKSKCKVLNFVPEKVEDVPDNAFGFAATDDKGNEYAADGFLKPVAMYKDPFVGGVLVWCECVDSEGKPMSHNTRASCSAVVERVGQQEPWFGMEQV